LRPLQIRQPGNGIAEHPIAVGRGSGVAGVDPQRRGTRAGQRAFRNGGKTLDRTRARSCARPRRCAGPASERLSARRRRRGRAGGRADSSAQKAPRRITTARACTGNNALVDVGSSGKACTCGEWAARSADAHRAPPGDLADCCREQIGQTVHPPSDRIARMRQAAGDLRPRLVSQDPGRECGVHEPVVAADVDRRGFALPVERVPAPHPPFLPAIAGCVRGRPEALSGRSSDNGLLYVALKKLSPWVWGKHG